MEEKYGAILMIPDEIDRNTPEFKEFENDIEMLVESVNKFMEGEKCQD